MVTVLDLLVYLFLFACSVTAFEVRFGASRTPGQFRKELERRRFSSVQQRDVDPLQLYPAHNFSVPVDHFHNETQYEPHSNATFPLRYWFDASHYKPGGPVIVLQGGETDGSDRLVYLQKGILAQLSQATHGIGVVLEHRYYGTSVPTEDYSTHNLRFLTTAQAMADEAYFAQSVRFPGLEEYGDLTSKSAAWISYGGSYAGAFSAFLRVQYPDVFWGSISSSGVTKAIYDYWQYAHVIAEKAPQDCIAVQRTLTNVMDHIWIQKNNTGLPRQLKNTLGLPDVTYDTDVAFLLIDVIGAWQSLNWDPEVTSNEFYNYCDNITAANVLYPSTETRRSNVSELITAGGYNASSNLVTQMLNLIGYVNTSYVAPCAASSETQDQCFSTHNRTFYEQDSLADGSFRSWPYQYCTEWGFLQTGDTPKDELPLYSRTIDLEFSSIICRDAFNITQPPNVDAVNKYGGYDIAYDRLAIIDGDWDPWKAATPHAFEFGAQPRRSTSERPYILIPKSVHHWDENGLFRNETTASLPPQRIKAVHSQEVQFVRAWMKEWQARRPHGYGWKSPAPPSPGNGGSGP